MNKLELLISHEMGDVVSISGYQIIYANYGMSLIYQEIA